MKRRSLILAVALSAIISTSVLGAQVKIVVDGSALSAYGTIVDGRTLVPIRDISEALGATVLWDSESQRVTLSKPNVNIDMTGLAHYDTIDITMVIGEKSIIVNGEEFELDVPAQIIGDKTMVPLREVGGWFGGTVTWDDASKTVNIEKGLNDSLSDAKLQKVKTQLAEKEVFDRISGTPITGEILSFVSEDSLSSMFIFVYGERAEKEGVKQGFYEYDILHDSLDRLVYDMSGFNPQSEEIQNVNGVRVVKTGSKIEFCVDDLDRIGIY